MPSTITHAYFALDVYDALDKRTKELIKPSLDYLKVFAQGPDIFFFSYYFNPIKSKQYKNLGSIMHNYNTKGFFINLINYIKDNNLLDNKYIMSFLYGFIMHYTLDKQVHPYVIYKTGMYNKKDKKTYKYKGLHDDLECFIDCYMMQVRGRIKPRYFNISKFCFNIKEVSVEVTNMIDSVFFNTYKGKIKYTDFGKSYFKSYKKMKTLYKLLRYDKYGIKKKMYKTIDKLRIRNLNKFEPISYNVSIQSKKHYLNIEKQFWNHPYAKDEMYNHSFLELYIIALKNSTKYIEMVNKVIYDNENIATLDEVFSDLSYLSNKPIEDTLNTKEMYFEF